MVSSSPARTSFVTFSTMLASSHHTMSALGSQEWLRHDWST